MSYESGQLPPPQPQQFAKVTDSDIRGAKSGSRTSQNVNIQKNVDSKIPPNIKNLIQKNVNTSNPHKFECTKEFHLPVGEKMSRIGSDIFNIGDDEKVVDLNNQKIIADAPNIEKISPHENIKKLSDAES